MGREKSGWRRAPMGRAALAAIAAAAAAIASLQPSIARATLTWDPNGAATGTGGSAAWDPSTSFWLNPATLGYQPWNTAAPQPAIFGGTAGTTTIGSIPITATAGLQFDTAGYNITNGTITLGGTITANQN